MIHELPLTRITGSEALGDSGGWFVDGAATTENRRTFQKLETKWFWQNWQQLTTSNEPLLHFRQLVLGCIETEVPNNECYFATLNLDIL